MQLHKYVQLIQCKTIGDELGYKLTHEHNYMNMKQMIQALSLYAFGFP